jgi:predicted permease
MLYFMPCLVFSLLSTDSIKDFAGRNTLLTATSSVLITVCVFFCSLVMLCLSVLDSLSPIYFSGDSSIGDQTQSLMYAYANS